MEITLFDFLTFVIAVLAMAVAILAALGPR
jgi:hypothetical protein